MEGQADTCPGLGIAGATVGRPSFTPMEVDVEQASKVQLLTAEDVARRFKVSPKSVHRWAAARQIRSFRLGQRTVRFDPSDVEAFLKVRGTDGTNRGNY